MVLFCGIGWRSALATKALNEMGFENAINAEGGFEALKSQGLEIISKDKQ